MAQVPRNIGCIAIPVEDMKVIEGRMPQEAFFALQRNAYKTRITAVGIDPSELPNMAVVPNKFPGDFFELTYGADDDGHPLAAMDLVSGSNGEERRYSLQMPRAREGLYGMFPDGLPKTPDELTKALCCTKNGGNATNGALGILGMLSAIPKADRYVHIDVLTPPVGLMAQQLEEARERINGLMHVQPLDVPPRKSLHVDHRILHGNLNTQTLMMSLRGAPLTQIAAEIERYAPLLQRCAGILCEHDLAEIRSQAPTLIIPNSGSIDTLQRRKDQSLLVNDQEIVMLLARAGIPTLLEPGEHFFPSIVNDGSLDALATVNRRLETTLQHLTDPHQDGERQLAHIGKRDLNCLDVYSSDGQLTAVEGASIAHSPFKEGLLRMAESDAVRPDITSGTGRGDAASIAYLLRFLPLEELIGLWREAEGGGTHLELTQEQRRAAHMFIPAVVGRVQASLVNHCEASNLFGAMDPKNYRRILGACIGAALRCAAQVRGDIGEHPQVLRDDETGWSAATWKLPAVPRIP